MTPRYFADPVPAKHADPQWTMPVGCSRCGNAASYARPDTKPPAIAALRRLACCWTCGNRTEYSGAK